ncbi:unnamed protein product [Ambrosiozyma monospora]|uniref:Unnamed protein product n=1 Tax=Ambrosiozyma monospora TaxID=43982 RepID=A0ACB5T4B0_AMBMO|nr:unnamed protein product [Ambrosiozyma monospora]
MKLHSSSLLKFESHYIPFDISECPNIKNLSLRLFKPEEYYNALCKLEKSTVTELQMYNMDLIGIDEDEMPIKIVVPSSVRSLTLIAGYAEEDEYKFKLYSVVLFSNLNSLKVSELPVVLKNTPYDDPIAKVMSFLP